MKSGNGLRRFSETSDDGPFAERSLLQDALVPQCRQIQAGRPTLQHPFRHRATRCRRLLDTVARKAVAEMNPGDLRVRSQDGVMVEMVVVVVAGPGTRQFDGFERRNAMRQGRPDVVFESFVFQLEIIP